MNHLLEIEYEEPKSNSLELLAEQFMYTKCSELGIFKYGTCNSMNNLSSHCGLVDAKIRASDKDLPVQCRLEKTRENWQSAVCTVQSARTMIWAIKKEIEEEVACLD